MSDLPDRFSGRPAHPLAWTVPSQQPGAPFADAPSPLDVPPPSPGPLRSGMDGPPPPDGAPGFAATYVSNPPPAQAQAPAPSAKLVEKPHPLTPLVRAWVLVLAAVWAIGRELLNGGDGLRLPPLTWVTAGGALLLVTLIGFAYVDWRATSFVVDRDELRLESGVFTRTSERIRFDRIQSVDITEPFGARVLGLAEISIDVGAEGGHRLRYLSRARAAAMRDYLLARAHGVQPAELTNRVSTSRLDDRGVDDEVLVQLSPQRLVLGALLSHEFLLATVPMLIAVTVLTVWDPGGANVVSENPWLVLGAALPALGGLWSFVAHRVIGQWHYAFVRSSHGLKITRGLTSLTSQSLPRHRIQSLRISQPVWWRRLGLYRVDMAVLGNNGLTTDEDQAGRNSILLPVGTGAEVDLVLRTIWPGLRLDAIVIHPSPAQARWVQPLSQRWVGWGVDELVLVTRSGWLTRNQQVVPHARLQSLAMQQGPLARRLGLATVNVHTTQALAVNAAGNLDAAAARELLREEAAKARSARMEGLIAGPAS